MTKFRICSDLHLEAYASPTLAPYWSGAVFNRLIPVLDDDADTVLVLAGDIVAINALTSVVNGTPHQRFFERMCERFRAVLYLAGNHEYYHGTFPSTWRDIQRLILDDYNCPNLHFFDDDTSTHDVDNVTVVGATLWTDFGRDNPLAMVQAQRSLNDYRRIDQVGGELLQPPTILAANARDQAAVIAGVQDGRARGRKVLVATHHAPLYESIHPKRRRDAAALRNMSYYSDMSSVMIDNGPDVWVHGHTHDASRYRFAHTEIICNSFGYPWETLDHDPELVVSL